METFNSSDEEKRAKECINRGNFWVCKECADKYSKNPIVIQNQNKLVMITMN